MRTASVIPVCVIDDFYRTYTRDPFGYGNLMPERQWRLVSESIEASVVPFFRGIARSAYKAEIIRELPKGQAWTEMTTEDTYTVGGQLGWELDWGRRLGVSVRNRDTVSIGMSFAISRQLNTRPVSIVFDQPMYNPVRETLSFRQAKIKENSLVAAHGSLSRALSVTELPGDWHERFWGD